MKGKLASSEKLENVAQKRRKNRELRCKEIGNTKVIGGGNKAVGGKRKNAKHGPRGSFQPTNKKGRVLEHSGPQRSNVSSVSCFGKRITTAKRLEKCNRNGRRALSGVSLRYGKKYFRGAEKTFLFLLPLGEDSNPKKEAGEPVWDIFSKKRHSGKLRHRSPMIQSKSDGGWSISKHLSSRKMRLCQYIHV